jgi:hypothetical protein
MGVLFRLNRPDELDGEADAAPGLKDPGHCAGHALAELVERGCAEVIVTTNPDPLIVIALSGAGIERRSRVALPRSRAPTESRCLCPWGLESPCVRGGTRSPLVVVHPRIGDLSPLQANTKGQAGPAIRRRKGGASVGPPDRSGHVTCGNDEGGQPEWSRRPGPDCGSRLLRLIIREAR